MQWFRFYTEALNDPKVQRLSPRNFKYWVNLLCLAAENEPRGHLPSDEDTAYALRLTEESWQTVAESLMRAGLIDAAPDGLKIHAWDRRQYASDSKDTGAAERMRRLRARRAGQGALW